MNQVVTFRVRRSTLAVVAVLVGLALLSRYAAGIGWIATWIIVTNAVTFALFGLDKWAARRGWRRVPERTLHGCALAGGSPGALLGQGLFRHKTAKASFQVVFWIIVLVQVGALCVYLYRVGAA